MHHILHLIYESKIFIWNIESKRFRDTYEPIPEEFWKEFRRPLTGAEVGFLMIKKPYKMLLAKTDESGTNPFRIFKKSISK